MSRIVNAPCKMVNFTYFYDVAMHALYVCLYVYTDSVKEMLDGCYHFKDEETVVFDYKYFTDPDKGHL